MIDTPRMSRRFFLGGALALTAVAIIRPTLVFAPPPRIWADGVHDDWAGLQALLRKEPFEVETEGAFAATEGQLLRGTFRVSQTFMLPDESFTVRGSTFIRLPWEPILFETPVGHSPHLIESVEIIQMTDPRNPNSRSGEMFIDQWRT